MSFKFNFTANDKDTLYYYSSARFRELQLDYIMNGKKVPQFPTKVNFFVGGYEDAMLYTSLIDNHDIYYNEYGIDKKFLKGAKGPIGTYLRRNFNVTHVYRASKKLKLFELMNRDNIKHLLFDDPDSPFHISKSDIKVHESTDVLYHIRSSAKGKAFAQIHNVSVANRDATYNFSAFSMLVAATNYFDDELSRYSSYSFDYTLIELLRTYLSSKGVKCDGWYQPKVGDFHVEWAFFDPVKSLVADFNHSKSWSHVLKLDGRDIANMSLHKKQKTKLKLVEKWRAQEEKKAITELTMYQDALKQLDTQGIKSEYYKENYADMKGSLKEMITSTMANLEYAKKSLEKIRNKPVDNNVIATKLLGYKLFGKNRVMGSEVQKYVNKQMMACEHGGCVEQPVSYNRCQKQLHVLVEEMDLYSNPNNDHHVGERVSDHTIWVTRAMHRWLGYRDHPWTMDIENGLRNLALGAAFLHDIGKIGDADVTGLVQNGVKSEHPYHGYEYLTELSSFKGTDSKESRILYNVMSDCRFKHGAPIHLATVATTAAMHHHLGEFLMAFKVYKFTDIGNFAGDWKPPYVMKRTNKLYLYHNISGGGNILSAILNTTKTELKYMLYLFDFLRLYADAGGDIYNTNELDQALKIVLAVSAADVYGAHPVENTVTSDSIYEASLSTLLDPQILHHDTRKHTSGQSAVVPEIFRPYYRYLYYTLGINERNMLLTYVSTIADTGVFLEAWLNWKLLMNHIDNPKRRLPPIFATLDMSSTETFITGLLRMIKSGELPKRTTLSQRVPEKIINELKMEYDDTSENISEHPLISKFINHKHPELIRQAPEVFGQAKVDAGRYKALHLQAPF